MTRYAVISCELYFLFKPIISHLHLSTFYDINVVNFASKSPYIYIYIYTYIKGNVCLSVCLYLHSGLTCVVRFL